MLRKKQKFSPLYMIVGVLLLYFIFFFINKEKNEIKQKVDGHFRIGYINLHSAKVAVEDLRMMIDYDCDLWLFLEWNGDNFDNDTTFRARYTKHFEARNKETYGVLILSKNRNVKILNIFDQVGYICNYPINLIKYTTPDLMTVYLAHAPPPVPKCGYQTSLYIKHLSDLVAKTEHETNSIIIGDFNTLPFHKSFTRILRLGYKDSYFAINNSHVGTFSPLSWFPKIFKIDYIFNKSGLKPQKISYFELKSSDHKGLIADFSMKTKN